MIVKFGTLGVMFQTVMKADRLKNMECVSLLFLLEYSYYKLQANMSPYRMEFILPKRRHFIDYKLYCSHSVSVGACSSHTCTTGGSAVLTVTLYEVWRYNLLDCISTTRVSVGTEKSTKR
jgi:hypothetical protein